MSPEEIFPLHLEEFSPAVFVITGGCSKGYQKVVPFISSISNTLG